MKLVDVNNWVRNTYCREAASKGLRFSYLWWAPLSSSFKPTGIKSTGIKSQRRSHSTNIKIVCENDRGRSCCDAPVVKLSKYFVPTSYLITCGLAHRNQAFMTKDPCVGKERRSGGLVGSHSSNYESNGSCVLKCAANAQPNESIGMHSLKVTHLPCTR